MKSRDEKIFQRPLDASKEDVRLRVHVLIQMDDVSTVTEDEIRELGNDSGSIRTTHAQHGVHGSLPTERGFGRSGVSGPDALENHDGIPGRIALTEPEWSRSPASRSYGS